MTKQSLLTQNNVSILYPQGFGFGTGSINIKQQFDTGALSYGALIVGAEVIENDDRVFKKVDTEAKDDGCGGGLVVFASMMRASVWGADLSGRTVFKDRETAAELLQKSGIKHGGHTDNHASGAQTRELLEQSGAVIKELADDHMEDFVIINDVESESFHQREFDVILHERGVQTTAQAFVVDLWRGRMYARLTATEAARLGQDKEAAFKKAMVDFLVRTLATAGTLTSGDQPVFYRSSPARSRQLFFIQKLRLPLRRK